MTGLNGPLLIAFLAFATGALALFGLALAWEAWRERRRERVVKRRLQQSDAGGAGVAPSELFRDSAEEEPGALEALVEALPQTADLRHLLEQAALPWSAARFYALTILIGSMGALIGYLFTGYVLVAGTAAVMAGTVPYLYVRYRKRKRVDAFEESFPEAIDLLGRAIRAGHAFSTGLQMVAEEMPEPLSVEFRQVFEEQRFGLPLDDSMLALADRIESLDVRIFVTAVMIQREVGGNLAEILDNLSHTIRERFKIQRQVRVYTAQGRFTGYLLGALPIAVGVLITMLNPEYMSVLWTESFGRMMIAVALLLQIVGFFVIRRIVDIEI